MACFSYKVFTKDSIATIASFLSEDTTVHFVFQVFTPLAETKASLLMEHDDDIIEAIKELKGMGVSGNKILTSLSKHSEVGI